MAIKVDKGRVFFFKARGCMLECISGLHVKFYIGYILYAGSGSAVEIVSFLTSLERKCCGTSNKYMCTQPRMICLVYPSANSPLDG